MAPTKGQKAVKALREAVSGAMKAQAKDPVGAALWPYLMAVELVLLMGYRVRAELWGILLVLALLKAHAWALENAHRHPLLVNIFSRLPKKKTK